MPCITRGIYCEFTSRPKRRALGALIPPFFAAVLLPVPPPSVSDPPTAGEPSRSYWLSPSLLPTTSSSACITPSRPNGHLLSGFVEQRSYSDPTAATKCQGSTRSASQESSDNHNPVYLFFFLSNSNKCLLKYSTNHNDLNNNQPMQYPTYKNLGNR